MSAGMLRGAPIQRYELRIEEIRWRATNVVEIVAAKAL